MPTKHKATAGQELALIDSVYQEQTEFIAVTANEFDHAKTSCLQKTQEWDTYSSLYTDEMKALSEVIDILCSNDARRTFGVQSSQTPKLARTPYPSCRPRSPPGVHWTR